MSYAFCSASAVKARFFRVREYVMLPFHYSRIITPHSKVPVSTRAWGVNKLVHHGCACAYSFSIKKSILLNMVSGPFFTASQLLVDTTAPLNSFFGNISNLHQHFTIALCRSTESLSSMYKPCDQTVTITVTGRPDFMINVYSKVTETPLKAESPRLRTTSSSLIDPSS